MSAQDADRGRGWRNFWLKGSGSVAANIVATLIAAGLVSIATSLLAVFARITPSSVIAFRILVAGALLAAFAAATGLVMQFFGSSRAGAASRDLAERLTSLAANIPNMDWSYDSAEHERGVYERLRKVAENPDVTELKVVTIFRDPRFEELGELQRAAVRSYYHALETALATRRGFDYDRVVVVRGALRGRQPSGRDLLAGLTAARPDFMEHCRRLMQSRGNALGARGEIRFYGDTGRLVDVAFAVALDRQKAPRTLVLEIGTTRPGAGQADPGHPALGLLAFENPSPQLAEAFLLAHQALRAGSTTVAHVPEEMVKDVLRIR